MCVTQYLRINFTRDERTMILERKKEAIVTVVSTSAQSKIYGRFL